MARQPHRDGEGAGAVPACLSVCQSVCVQRERAGPGPAGSRIPCPGSAEWHKLRCGPGGEGFAFSAAAEQKQRCSAGARPTAPLVPSPHAKFLSSECLLFYLPLCCGPPPSSAERGRSEKHGGSFSCGCAAPAAGTAAPRPARAGRGGRLSPAGTPDLPAGWGRGCPRRHREPRRGEGGEGASTAPRRAPGPRSPPQELGCRSGRRLVQPRRVSPGAPGTRCASEEATPLPIFIHLLALLY